MLAKVLARLSAGGAEEKPGQKRERGLLKSYPAAARRFLKAKPPSWNDDDRCCSQRCCWALRLSRVLRSPL